MKYYKKENVEREIVEEYKITKLKCDHCGKMIEEGVAYVDVSEIPKSIRDDIVWKDICMDCFVDYCGAWVDTWQLDYYNKMECEFGIFRPHNERYVDEEKDVEDTDVETN